MIKRVSLALVALGLSASAYAAHPVEEMLPAAPPTVAVTIPQQTGSWSVGVEALYQALGSNDFNFSNTADVSVAAAVLEQDVPPFALAEIDASVNARTHEIKPKYGWGWEVDVAYLFPGNGNDVELSWKHLNKSKTRSVSNDGGLLVGPGVFVPPTLVDVVGDPATGGLALSGGWDEASGKERNEYDHVDLVFGQKMDFAQKVTLKAFGGLRYARIESKNTGSYFGVDQDVVPVEDTGDSIILDSEVLASYHSKSEFNGVGPRAGLDAKVRLGGGFAITGTVGGSLLVGHQDNKVNTDIIGLFAATGVEDGVNTLLAAAETELQGSAKSKSHSRVVPELDTRIGINYGWAFNPDAALEVELGYEAINYFNIKQNGTGSYVDTHSNSTNFSVRGPYLRAQLDLA